MVRPPANGRPLRELMPLPPRKGLSQYPPGSAAWQAALTLDDLRKLNILIIDENISHACLLQDFLSQGGFIHTAIAYSGREAMRRLQRSFNEESKPIDMVIMDLSLHDMDAYELCKEIKSNPDWMDIPVLMMTIETQWQEETVTNSIHAGATDIIFKPISGTELLPRVIAGLSLKLERDLRRQREKQLEAELYGRKTVEERLRYLVGHDDLTGLANRRRLEQSVEIATLYARYKNRQGALLYLDIDQFKIITNTEGHTAGDNVLKKVSDILNNISGPGDMLARIGADDFAILLEDADEARALEFSESIRHRMDEFRYDTGSKTYKISVSIGIRLISAGEESNPTDILAHADQACFIAKQLGRNTVHVFNKNDVNVINLRQDIKWVDRIRDAIDNDELELVSQPLLNVTENSINHFEALIRMKGQGNELITPVEFIPVAERMGLIHEIDRWVVSRAIEILENMDDSNKTTRVSVNLSGKAFEDPSLLTLIKQKLDNSGVEAQQITFEITETSAIANLAKTREMVKHIRSLGCKFALDDFGTGFSSYSYLKEFPVDFLKIDGSFIANLVSDSTDQALVKSMIEIAHTLGKKVIAEYVEDRETLELLCRYGIDLIQGYYIGKPSRVFNGDIPSHLAS